MKARHFSAILLASFAILLGGCTTPGQNADTVAANVRRVRSITKLGVYAGTKAALIKAPETRQSFERANESLGLFIAQANWDVTAAADVLVAAGIPALETDEGQLILTGSFLLLDLFGPSLDLKSSVYSEAFIRGASDGLTLALANAVVSRPASLTTDPTKAQLEAQARATRKTK